MTGRLAQPRPALVVTENFDLEMSSWETRVMVGQRSHPEFSVMVEAPLGERRQAKGIRFEEVTM